MIAGGVRVAEADSLPFKLTDDGRVLEWLLPIVSNILNEADLEHDAESLKEVCSLRWCLMGKNVRLRTRKLEQPDEFADRMTTLAAKVLVVVNGVQHENELESSLQKDFTRALVREVETVLMATADNADTSTSAAPTSTGVPEENEDESAAKAARTRKETLIRAQGKRLLQVKACENKDMLGIDNSPVFEGWTVDVGEVQVKPKGAPRGKSAASMSAAQLATAKEKAKERYEASLEGEPTTKLCATYSCDLCSSEERGPASGRYPGGKLERREGHALTSFPQGLIAHRTLPNSCIRNTVQTLSQLQAERARRPYSQMVPGQRRISQPRYSREGFRAEGESARPSNGKASAAAATPATLGKRKAPTTAEPKQ